MTYEIFHWTNLTLGFFYSIEILLIASQSVGNVEISLKKYS